METQPCCGAPKGMHLANCLGEPYVSPRTPAAIAGTACKVCGLSLKNSLEGREATGFCAGCEDHAPYWNLKEATGLARHNVNNALTPLFMALEDLEATAPSTAAQRLWLLSPEDTRACLERIRDAMQALKGATE